MFRTGNSPGCAMKGNFHTKDLMMIKENKVKGKIVEIVKLLDC